MSNSQSERCLAKAEHIMIYSLNQAAKLLRLRPSYLKFLITSGEIDFFVPPGRKQIRITHDALLQFIHNNTYNTNGKSNDKEKSNATCSQASSYSRAV